MIRYIEVGSQITLERGDCQFAFYDTVTDRFLELGGAMVFDSVQDLVERAAGERLLERCLSVIPPVTGPRPLSWARAAIRSTTTDRLETLLEPCAREGVAGD